MRIANYLILLIFAGYLGGCAVAAAPCRVTGAVAKTVPIVGAPVGAVLDACGDVID